MGRCLCSVMSLGTGLGEGALLEDPGRGWSLPKACSLTHRVVGAGCWLKHPHVASPRGLGFPEPDGGDGHDSRDGPPERQTHPELQEAAMRLQDCAMIVTSATSAASYSVESSCLVSSCLSKEN